MSLHLDDRRLHQRCLELAAVAVDFDLSRAERSELDTHLADCPSCNRRGAALRTDAGILTRQLELLPSLRVDAAVHAAIARRSDRPQRLLLLVAAALLLLGALAVGAVGASLVRDRQTLPITVVPTAPVAVASLEPPSPSPTPTPAPSAPVATEVDPAVLLRVEIRPDVSVGRTPSLTVYRDGTVLRRGDLNGLVSRLTPAGLGLLLAPATDSGLFAASGDIRPGPDWAAGFVTYAIDLRQGEAIVHRSTTNVLLTPATKAESERIIALAERLDGLESWLPAGAWDIGPAAATPYVASHYLLKVTAFKDQPDIEYPAQPLDVADVDWPLTGSLEGFGKLQEPPPLGDGTISRCAVITLAEAVAVERALAAAPFVSGGERLQADLGWAASNSHVTVSLAPLLPDDALDCSVDLGWP